MLKITAIGTLINEVELRIYAESDTPYAVMRIASDRKYRDKDGKRITDFISIKVRGTLAQRCFECLSKGSKIAASGDFETLVFPQEDGSVQTGFLIKANEVEFLSPRNKEKQSEEKTPEITE